LVLLTRADGRWWATSKIFIAWLGGYGRINND